MKHRNRLLAFLPLAFVLALAGCSRLGTAVVIWPPVDSEWSPGDVVPAKDESLLRKTYRIGIPGSKELGEIDTWRVRLFPKEKEAVAWAATWADWKDTWADATSQGLPVRSAQDNQATQVYRLRDGETMKVMAKGDGPVQVGNLQGTWYKVLTEGGVEGYVFDYNLTVYVLQDGNKLVLNSKDVGNPQIDDFLSAPWYPDYYRSMVQDGTIDLTEMRSDYGLFPDPAAKTLVLKLKDADLRETWTEVVSAGRDRYDFVGTSFRVTFNQGYVGVQYIADGREVSQAFVRLNQDVDALIRQERERRDAVLAQLVDNGPAYGSRTYGDISFSQDGTFTWTGKSALISRGLLTQDTGNRGRLLLDRFISPTLSGRHAGALALRFDSGDTAVFLYAFEDGGLRLTYVPPSAVDRKVVRTDQFIDPVRLFFAPVASGQGG